MDCDDVNRSFSTPSFYGVFPRHDGEGVFESEKLVFTDKSEVLLYIKINKKARFKAFSNEEDAINFSLYGSEPGVTSPNVSLSTPSAEKSIYKALKPQDLVRFRTGIEKQDMDFVQRCVNENPRYLIGSGDTPSILKEGPRYNALHVCALSNNATACNYILKTIANFEFVERLYATNIGVFERCKKFLDLYLNTPDKTANETPLHFASKYGHLDVVKALVLHKQCNINLKNRYDQTPMDMICARATGDALKNMDAIKDALESTFFVPVLRSPDNAFHPVIGEPFIPNSFQAYRVHEGLLTPETPQMDVKAIAGPMREDEARHFRKKLKTPPRFPKNVNFSAPSRLDPDKGIEKVGRGLASEFNVGWKEYWDFLDDMVDLSAPEGLAKLEKYLQSSRYNQQGTRLFKQQELAPSKLYEGNQNLKLNALSPMSELCMNMENLHLEDLDNNENCNNMNFDSNSCINNSYQVYANRIVMAIKTKNVHSFALAINHVQSFIAGCSTDARFSKVDFSQSHFIIVKLVYKCITPFQQEALAFAQNLTEKNTLNSIAHKMQMPSPTWCDFSKSYYCILFFLIDLLKQSDHIDNINQKHASCDCKIFRSNRSKPQKARFKKKLNFSADEMKLEPKQEKSTAVISACDNDSDEYFSDSSSYSTPESNDDSGEGESFFEAESGTLKNCFIDGDVPSKTDVMVYEVIENVAVSSTDYPFVFFYKLMCEKYFKNHPFKTPSRFKPVRQLFPSSPLQN